MSIFRTGPACENACAFRKKGYPKSWENACTFRKNISDSPTKIVMYELFANRHSIYFALLFVHFHFIFGQPEWKKIHKLLLKNSISERTIKGFLKTLQYDKFQEISEWPSIGTPWCRGTGVSQTAVRQVAVVFPVCSHLYERDSGPKRHVFELAMQIPVNWYISTRYFAMNTWIYPCQNTCGNSFNSLLQTFFARYSTRFITLNTTFFL